MAQVVAAFAVSHTALMIRARAAADPTQVAKITAAFDEVRQRIEEAKVDALLVIGSDHYKTFYLDHMPAFCIGVGEECEGWGEAGVPKYRVKVHSKLGEAILTAAVESGFDLSFSLDMPLDHAFMCPLHFLCPEMAIPVVPLFQNSTAPPLPGLKRCFALGGAIRKAIENCAAVARVAVLATGGLSHTVPIPNWSKLGSDEDGRRWLRFMSQGRRQADPELERQILTKIKELVDKGLGRINEEFDHRVLDLISKGEYQSLAEYGEGRIEREGGNGAREIRNWLTLAGTVPERKGRILAYEAVPQWLTGIAVVAFD